jgi:signal transduction histidine kinase/HAMP domain-containing protein
MNLLHLLRSRIQYKIILPFLLLTLLVALSGSAIVLIFITGNAQERLNNQLAQVARDSGDTIIQIERANLAFLRELSFAPANPSTSAPALAAALASADQTGLARAVDPYLRVSNERGVIIDRLIVFDSDSQTQFDWERAQEPNQPPMIRPSNNIGQLWFVPEILAGATDGSGDKFAGLLALDEQQRYLFTVAPIQDGERIIGGIIAATRLENLVRQLAATTQAAIVTIHEPAEGLAFASTATLLSGSETLQVRPALLPLVRQLQNERLEQGVFDTVSVNQRAYQFAYAPLRIREQVIGLLSVALASDYVISPWQDARLPLVALTVALMLTIIGLGLFIARQITRPLHELVNTAEAVTAGNLERRSQVVARDEVGTLAGAFNTMTAHLFSLFRTVRSEANRRAAIFESIADGLAVVNSKGELVLANSALRRLLNLAPGAPLPTTFEAIPLTRLDKAALNFGSHSPIDLFQLGNKIVRVTRSIVLGDNDDPDGYVYVLQDMTSEVAVDRAKTNFIATISHELRTPMTVISGNSDLMLSGFFGSLSEQHKPLVQSIRHYAGTTTNLINNMITAAGLDSGTLTFEIEPLDLRMMLQRHVEAARRNTTNKAITLYEMIPDDLPLVAADESHLSHVVRQILDNACRYTEAGEITIRAYVDDQLVRVDISDTGPGIAPDLHSQIFERFTRGPDGIISTERGIGLGLALARELLELQGGSVWLEASSSHGSTFSFTLPRAHAEHYIEQTVVATSR